MSVGAWAAVIALLKIFLGLQKVLPRPLELLEESSHPRQQPIGLFHREQTDTLIPGASHPYG